MSDLTILISEARAAAAKEGCDIIEGTPNTLLLDLDTESDDATFNHVIPLVKKYVEITKIERWRSKSGKGWHVVVHLDTELPVLERLLLQAALGSDGRREVLALLRTWNGIEEPSLLFRPKGAKVIESPVRYE